MNMMTVMEFTMLRPNAIHIYLHYQLYNSKIIKTDNKTNNRFETVTNEVIYTQSVSQTSKHKLTRNFTATQDKFHDWKII